MLEVPIAKARSDQQILGKTRSCSLSEQLADRMNIDPIRHVRIDTDRRSFYCIVKETHADPETPFRMAAATRNRFNLEPDQMVRLSPIVPTDDYLEARRTGGFAETVWDDGSQDTLLMMAQHGGDIEYGTDDIPIRCYKQLKSTGQPISVWMCHGFNNSFTSDGFTNWHISKPCRSIESYPGLQQLAARRFDYTVSLHVQGADSSRQNTTENEYYIGVGGNIDNFIRKDVAERLQDTTGKTVETDLDAMQYNGTHEMNSINYLSKDGDSLQLELTPRTAYVYRKRVAEVICSVFGELTKD